MRKPLSEMTDKELRQHILEIEGAYSRCRDWWESHTLEGSWARAISEQNRRIIKSYNKTYEP